MVDFFMISTQMTKNGIEIKPKFKICKSKDLMIRGSDFYAIWLEDEGRWSTDEQDAINLIDKLLDDYAKEHAKDFGSNVHISYLWDASSGSIDAWHKYVQKQSRDNYNMLDEKIIFQNVPINKTDYASKRLPYPLKSGPIDGYDLLMNTLYSDEERHKIEWAIGSVVSGDSKFLQKFLVFYGSAGTGKSTVLNIIEKLFAGYTATFDAKAIGSNSSAFALEPFKDNPLVAIQHDGDLSKIEDNTRLNSLVSHEKMIVNEKHKTTYTNSFKAFLFMGTNRPVKITDSRSGLLRRLIDVSPTGNKLSISEYNKAYKKIDFELGAIAQHCLDVYLASPGYYDNYIPTSMMGASNDFFNFMVDRYSSYLNDDSVTLKLAWDAYKQYCSDANVPYPMSQRAFKEELKNYFYEYYDRYTDPNNGERYRSYFKGFRVDKFESGEPQLQNNTKNSLIVFKEQHSILDDICKDWPAQYANDEEKPLQAWNKVTTKLSDIDTHRLHYLFIPDEFKNYIMIDFDIKDLDGNKSYEKNLEEASKWPATYAELSKGGAGIHLIYIYDGNVDDLAPLYDKDIEIKIFTGKSSMRRRLSMCNDNSISHISSGLPKRKKEKKMVDKNQMQTEAGLRTTIKKCLNKEIHSSTKSNIDFIAKILQDAYDQGMSFDVSDLSNDIFAFAASSTHQKATCLKTVSKMIFKSDEPENIKDSEGDIVFYDIEVFPNLFLVNWKIKGEENPVVRMINPTPQELEKLTKFKLIGFNCRRYDNHIIWAAMVGGYNNKQLYELSQKIINNEPNCTFSQAYNLSYTDVYDFASAGNKKSLKKLEIEMGISHKELGLPWDKPVPEELWTKVAEYCDNDVIATEAAFNYLSSDWTARQILASLANSTVNDSTNSLTTKIIFGNVKKPQSEFCYRDLSKPVKSLDSEVKAFLEEACPVMMSKPFTPTWDLPFDSDNEEESLLPFFPGYEFKFGKSIYRNEEVGEGGYVYAKPGMHVNVALLDITSMHPHSTIAECLFGPRFTRAYREIVEGRVSIKHEAWNEVDKMLDGKLAPFIQRVKDGDMTSGQLANALKTAINSVYGLTDAKFDNPFRDIRNVDNIVAKRGALFMVDLKNAVEAKGYTVAHIKTDSIKIPNATNDIIKFVMDMGQAYGYTFEHEATYERMCLVNNAVYIARYDTVDRCQAMYGYVPGDNKKHPGEWTATGTQFAVPYVFKTLFSHEPIVFNDLCQTFAVSKGDLYLDRNEGYPDVTILENELDKLETKYKKGLISDTVFENTCAEKDYINQIAKGHEYQFVGRVGQFTPIKNGCNGGILYRYSGGKYYAAPGSTGYRWLESENVKGTDLENHIDTSYYVSLANDAIETINRFGKFEDFVNLDITPSFMIIPDNTKEDEGMPF